MLLNIQPLLTLGLALLLLQVMFFSELNIKLKSELVMMLGQLVITHKNLQQHLLQLSQIVQVQHLLTSPLEILPLCLIQEQV